MQSEWSGRLRKVDKLAAGSWQVFKNRGINICIGEPARFLQETVTRRAQQCVACTWGRGETAVSCVVVKDDAVGMR